MIFLTSPVITPRLVYISEILFRIILRTDYKLVPAEDAAYQASLQPGTVIISHGLRLPQTHVYIPAEKILYEEGFQEPGPIDHASVFRNPPGNDFSTDVLASAFQIITQYDQYLEPELDAHERYMPKGDISMPWLHMLADTLWQMATAVNPALKREPLLFDYQVTFDIDSPWLYKHKPFFISWGGMGKDLFRRDLPALKKRMRVLAGHAPDPYDTYDYIFRQVDAKKTVFFFLIDHNHPRDERHTHKNGAYRTLIRALQGKGCRVGIHPSYTSFIDPERIKSETGELSRIVDSRITICRMHYLRYRLPETYRAMIAAGIKHDYTTASPNAYGFLNGMATAFPWFDCAGNEPADLWLHPTMVMDRALQKQQDINLIDAGKILEGLIQITKRYGGTFAMLWHNSSLSEWKEWKGWRSVFEETMRNLSEKSDS